MYDLAIIGFGATGVSVLKNLADQVISNGLPSPKIAIISPHIYFAKGLAFGDADDFHKVNTPPKLMGMSDTEILGFENWILKNEGGGNTFPTRKKYATFIYETYEDIKENKILNLFEHKENAIKIKCINDFFYIETSSSKIESKKIVLSLGSLNGSNFPEIEEHNNFIKDRNDYNKISNNRILVAGTGLTAIDVFRSIKENKNSEIHLFSRHGYAPTCLTYENKYIPEFFSWKEILKSGQSKIKLNKINSLLQKEVAHIGNNSERKESLFILKSKGHSHFFSYLLNRAKKGELPYQDTLVSSRNYIHKAWRAMPIEDKIIFQRNYSADWASWRHPIPMEVIKELETATKEGLLHIHRVTDRPSFRNNQFHINTNFGRTVKGDVLIDGTGGVDNIKKIKTPLIKNLLDENLIESNILGGININPLTYECIVEGKPIEGLYNIGPLNKGVLFSTNAFWFNAKCAYDWSEQWAKEETETKNRGKFHNDF